MPTSATTHDLGQMVDSTRMGPRRWGVVGICFLIALLDGFDTQSIAFIGPAVAGEFGLAAADMTLVITASTAGMCLGAMVLGSLSDRFGRRVVVLVALVCFGLFSLLGSAARTPEQIVVLRFLIGIGMGGATPALLALTAEYSASKYRGIAMALVLLGLPGGALLGGLVAAAWLPAVGWRGIFLIGGLLPLLFAASCLVALPESPSLLVTRGTGAARRQVRRLVRCYFAVETAEDAEFEVAGAATKRARSPLFSSVASAPSRSRCSASTCSTGSPGTCCCCGFRPRWPSWGLRNRQLPWARWR